MTKYSDDDDNDDVLWVNCDGITVANCGCVAVDVIIIAVVVVVVFMSGGSGLFVTISFAVDDTEYHIIVLLPFGHVIDCH